MDLASGASGQDTDTLPAPKDLSATAAFATEVYLTWKKPAKGATQITVERAIGSGSFSAIATLPGKATAYTDSSVSPATNYSYRVYASNSHGRSRHSNVAAAQTTIALVTDPNGVFTEPNLSKPAYLASFVDPVFGTTITRIANDANLSFTTSNNGNGTWSSDARHNYQLFEPWSIDGSLYILENRTDDGGQNGGAGGSWLNLDGNQYTPKLGPPSNYPDPSADERWSPNPKYATQVIVAGDTYPTLWWFDIPSNTATRSWSLPFVPQYLGGGKGHITRDGRFVVMVDITLTKMVVVDMDPQPPYPPYPSQRIGPVYDIEGTIGGATYTGATAAFDPSGRYVLLHYNSKNGVGGEYLRVYNVNPKTLALKVHPLPHNTVQCTGNASDNWIYSVGHSDLTLNPFGKNEPVVIGQEACGNVGSNVPGVKTVNSDGIGHVMMVRLRDGAVTSLTDPGNYSGTALEAYADHISAQNSGLPGWVLVSYGPWTGEEGDRYYDEVIAVSLDGLQRVQRLAHMHSDFDGLTSAGASCAANDSDGDFNYRSEPHSVPSPDAKRIAFASNWLVNGDGSGACSIQDLIIDLRPGAQ